MGNSIIDNSAVGKYAIVQTWWERIGVIVHITRVTPQRIYGFRKEAWIGKFSTQERPEDKANVVSLCDALDEAKARIETASKADRARSALVVAARNALRDAENNQRDAVTAALRGEPSPTSEATP